MKTKEKMIEYLHRHKYDGLYSGGTKECACMNYELMDCESYCEDCKPGYVGDCNCGKHELHIGPKLKSIRNMGLN